MYVAVSFPHNHGVIPAKAGISVSAAKGDSRLRGNDVVISPYEVPNFSSLIAS